MEIIPRVGLSSVRFGITPSEVKSIMGEKLTFERWMGGNLNDSLYYPAIVLCFDKHDGYGPRPDARLTEMWIDKDFYVSFRGMPLFGHTMESMIQLLRAQGVGYELSEGEGGFGMYVREYNWELAFENDQLVRVYIYA